MAHYVHRRRYNPDFLGFDPEDLGLEAAGLGLTALLSSQVTLPFARSLYLAPPGVMSGLEDAASAGVTTWGEGLILRLLDNEHLAHRVERGGALLTLAKVVSAFIPAVGLTVQTGGFRVPGFGTPAAAGLAPQAAGAPLLGGPSGGTAAAGAAAGPGVANPAVPASQQKYPAISGYGATSLQANLGL